MPLKILILTHEYPPVGGGAGNASYFFSKELVKLGAQVEVVTSSFNSLPAGESDSGFSVFRIPSLRKKIVNSNPVEQASFCWTSWRWIIREFDRLKPDCIIAFHTFPAGLTAYFVKKIKKVPYITMLRGHDVPGWSPKEMKFYHFIAKPMIHTVWKNSSRIAANSQGLRNLAMKNSPYQEIRVIQNGVDSDIYQPDAAAYKPRNETVILACGRLKIQKRFDLLLNAVHACIQKERSIKFVLKIAGEGPERSRLEGLCREYKMPHQVVFLNWLDKPRLREEYQKADIFVSASDFEGMPNVILEAMACGLPIIATKTLGSEELVQDGINGFLVPVNKPEPLSDALLKLIQDSILRKNMGDRSRSIAVQSFSWNLLAKKLLNLALETQENFSLRKT